MKEFAELHKASIAKGNLTPKTKELIALGIVNTAHSDGCIAYHVHDSLQAGESSEEILKSIGVAIIIGGRPFVRYGCEAMEVLDPF